MHWTGKRVSHCPDWLHDALYRRVEEPGAVMRVGRDVHIFTADGVLFARPGDWIVRAPGGGIYPVGAAIFEALNQPAGEPANADCAAEAG